MKYVGSKNRLAKEILPIILANRFSGQTYVEPFVGGCNLIDKVSGNRIGGDININVISLFQGLQEGFIPPETITEEEYYEAKEAQAISPRRSFIGFGCSYSGKWWGGYARGNSSMGVPRNYCMESKNNILKQREGLEGVTLVWDSYHNLSIPDNSLIYCDPPYRYTTKYKDSIDYDHFYAWCKTMKSVGHTIFISEFYMPEPFKEVWSKERATSLTQETGAKRNIERLYTL